MTADLKQGVNLAGKILASGQLTGASVLAFTGTPTGGTFAATVTNANNTVTTANQTYASSYTAAALQTALTGLTNVGSGNCTVTGSNGGPFTISFASTLPGVAQVTPNLTGGTNPSANVTPAAITVYTVPASTAAKIATAVLCNTLAFAVAVNVFVVPSGGSADNTRAVVSGYVLAAGDSTKITEIEGALLDAGAFVAISSSAQNGVDYLLTGAESS